MAETIKIAGKRVPRNVVFLGAAAAAGFVGYAWWSKGGQDEPAPPDLPSPVEPPTDDTEFNVIGGGKRPQTNGEWMLYVRDQLISIGLDGGAVSSALGRFLAKQPLNKVDADIARQAIGLAGNPPEGGPWYVIEEATGGNPPPTAPPPETPPPAPSTPAQQPPQVSVPQTVGPVHVGALGGDRYGVYMNPTPGATSWRVRWELGSGPDPSGHGHMSDWTPAHAPSGYYGHIGDFFWNFGRPEYQFAVRVQAGNSAGWDEPGQVSAPTWSKP
jgi:hypothetical protein